MEIFDIPTELRKHVKWLPDEVYEDETSVLVMFITDDIIKDKEVTGKLDFITYRGKRVMPIYSDTNFDQSYRDANSEYFLDESAPEELRQIFYLPLSTHIQYIGGKNITVFHRIYLSAETYRKYYKWLVGKDLSRFNISENDLGMMQVIDAKEHISLHLTKK